MILELLDRGLKAEAQVPLKVFYKERVVGDYFADILVENQVIVEVKAVERLEKIHEAFAFTTWPDFELAARQAEVIAAALGRKRPELRDSFQRNFEVLAKDLKTLDQDIQTIVSSKPSTPLIVSHPVYDYFNRRYGLNVISVHWEPDKIPGKDQLAELKAIIEKHPAKWMIWEGQARQASVVRLESIGIGSIVFDPCSNVPDQGDFMTVMRRNVEKLRRPFTTAD